MLRRFVSPPMGDLLAMIRLFLRPSLEHPHETLSLMGRSSARIGFSILAFRARAVECRPTKAARGWDGPSRQFPSICAPDAPCPIFRWRPARLRFSPADGENCRESRMAPLASTAKSPERSTGLDRHCSPGKMRMIVIAATAAGVVLLERRGNLRHNPGQGNLILLESGGYRPPTPAAYGRH